METEQGSQSACQGRNNFFLPRVNTSGIQSKLAEFRSAARTLLGGGGFWIDVKAVGLSSSFYWIDGSALGSQF